MWSQWSRQLINLLVYASFSSCGLQDFQFLLNSNMASYVSKSDISLFQVAAWYIISLMLCLPSYVKWICYVERGFLSKIRYTNMKWIFPFPYMIYGSSNLSILGNMKCIALPYSSLLEATQCIIKINGTFWQLLTHVAF